MSKTFPQRHGVLAVGNLLIDKMKSITGYPRECMLTHIESQSISCGGGCLNILFDLVEIDSTLPLFVAGIVGQDREGSYILKQCNDRTIDSSNITMKPCSSTSYTDVFINKQNGNRTFFHNSGANNELDADFILSINSSAKIAHLAYLLVLPQLDKNDSEYGSQGARALKSLQDSGFKTSLDLVSDSDVERFEQWVKPALKYVDYLIINDEEAYALTGITPNENKDDYQQMVMQLFEMGVNDTVVIHYPEGATGAQLGKEVISVPAYRVEKQDIVSTLGAGDAFCAGVLYGLHENQSLQYCMQLGCASAHFNLFALSATDGAPSYQMLTELINH